MKQDVAFVECVLENLHIHLPSSTTNVMIVTSEDIYSCYEGIFAILEGNGFNLCVRSDTANTAKELEEWRQSACDEEDWTKLCLVIVGGRKMMKLAPNTLEPCIVMVIINTTNL